VVVQDLKLPESSNEQLYWEADDVYPNQVIYDLEKNKVIIPLSDEDVTKD
jgi:hypothetical protein